jgi:antitoxin component of MazEF toxin-antitoxin module
MQIKVERTLLRVGEDSFAVTLPKAWVSYKQLKHGDVVEVIVNDEITIRAVTPRQDATKAKSQ